MDLKVVQIEKPEEINFILGQSHFIKTVEDIYEVIIQSVPGVKFGVAFCEASQARLVRWTGTDDEMIELAQKNAMNIGAGHSFIVFLNGAFPIGLNQVIGNHIFRGLIDRAVMLWPICGKDVICFATQQ